MGWYEFSLPWGFLWSQTADSVIIMSLAHLSPSPLVITHWVWWAEVFLTAFMAQARVTPSHAANSKRASLYSRACEAKRRIIQRPKRLAKIYKLLPDKYILNCLLVLFNLAVAPALNQQAFHLWPIPTFLTRLSVIVLCMHFFALQSEKEKKTYQCMHLGLIIINWLTDTNCYTAKGPRAIHLPTKHQL